MNNVDKQKLSELLRKKDYGEKRKNYYHFHYYCGVTNSSLWAIAIMGIATIGGQRIREESIGDKVCGGMCLALSIIFLLIFIYQLFRVYPYERKMKVCERKISDINCQIAKELGEL